MKAIKLLLIVSVIFLFSCSSNDDGDTTPITQEVTATLNLIALASLPGTDATSLISFNGVPAASYTTEAIIGDEIIYKITTSSPDTVVRFIEFSYSSGSQELWSNGLETIFGATGEWREGLKVTSNAVNEEIVKFDMIFQLEVDGQLQSGSYIIDPKIKIKDRR